ncbi:MAG TPA: PilN domain-containing protein [Candidatus Sulfotelmatobacter sp.]|nr:PilN domain-containing protein [Candidatus Sulfotelmatobacter sp.]
MPSVDPGTLTDTLGSTPIANALRWWLDALAELGSDAAAALRAAATSSLTLELTEAGPWIVARETRATRGVLGTIEAQRLDDEAVRRTLRRLLGHGKAPAVALLLPANALLTRVIRLPAAAAADLPAIIEFEIGRHTPFTAERAYYRHRVIGRAAGAGTLDVELRVAPRDLIDGALRRLAAVGLAVDSVTAADTPARARHRVSLLPAAPASARAAGAPIRALAIAAGLAALAALVSPIAVAELRRAGIEREIRTLQPAVDRLLAAHAQQMRLSDALDAVVAAKRATPAAVETLAALTHALPDGSWLSSLQLAGHDLIIEGHSPAAAALAQPLETAGPFAQVSYRAPITRDPHSGLEQFQFEIRIAEGAP